MTLKCDLDGATAAFVQRRLEELLEKTQLVKSGDEPDTVQRLASVLLGDFNAQETHSAIARAYADQEANSNEAVADPRRRAQAGARDWDDDALAELAKTGTVEDMAEPATSPAASPATSPSAQTYQPHEADASSERFMLFSPTAGVQQPASIDDAVAGLRLAGAGSWLDITEPTGQELGRLGRALKVHPLTIEDMAGGAGLAPQDKLERGAWSTARHGYVFATYAALDQTTSRAQIASTMSVLVFASGAVVTAHGTRLVPHVRATLVRLLGGRAEPTGPFIAYALLDSITDALEVLVRRTEKDVQAVDALVMQADGSKAETLQRIGAARRNLLGLWRVLAGKPEVVRQLARMGGAAGCGEDYGHHLGDVHDHLGSLLTLCGQCELVLARAHANYMAQLSLGLSRTTVGVGAFSNQWAVLAGILLPMQIAAGLFGQNITVPWMWDQKARRHDNLHAWLGIFAILASFLVCAVYVLRRHGAL